MAGPRRSVWLLYGYLVVYIVILIAALLSLWRTGVLAVIPTVWVFVALSVAVAFAAILLVTSLPPRHREPPE